MTRELAIPLVFSVPPWRDLSFPISVIRVHRGEILAFPVESNPILVHDYRPMQTLNVGAGRTDEEYKAAEEQRRADLRSDVQTYAFYFFVAAGLAAVGSGLLL